MSLTGSQENSAATSSGLNHGEEVVISLKGVSKTFHIKQNRFTTIRDELLTFFKSKKQTIKALDDINLDIRKGEIFGVIGRNGSGKSTLLSLIMGSILPDKGGAICTKGTLMKLTLGMGVDPNLSAKDNIYVNGSVIGLSFKRIGEIYHDILSFSGLTDFANTPVKFFSSGMKQRLLFSIAVYANADIFLLDEFFGGVGDEDFKKKSDEIFRKSILENKTIVIVSHSMKVIKKNCTRVAWINYGKIVHIGKPDEVVEKYRDHFNLPTPGRVKGQAQRKNA